MYSTVPDCSLRFDMVIVLVKHCRTKCHRKSDSRTIVLCTLWPGYMIEVVTSHDIVCNPNGFGIKEATGLHYFELVVKFCCKKLEKYQVYSGRCSVGLPAHMCTAK